MKIAYKSQTNRPLSLPEFSAKYSRTNRALGGIAGTTLVIYDRRFHHGVLQEKQDSKLARKMDKLNKTFKTKFSRFKKRYDT